MTSRLNIHHRSGFTIVEITVVIVIIAILAVGSIPFISRAQADARDDRREADIALITAAIERYYQDNGEYPFGEGSTLINSSWSTTSDASWINLSDKLVPKYIDKLPIDPSGETGNRSGSKVLAYDYYGNKSSYCGKGSGQMYTMRYNFENRPKKDTLYGECATNPLYYSSASNYRVARDNT